MPIPDRPVSGATIEAEWGQEVHDDTFTPLGTSVHGNASVAVTSSFTKLQLDVADDDPGGWLSVADDWIEVPTGADRLYLVIVKLNAQNGDADSLTVAAIYVNGVQIVAGSATNDGSTVVPFVVTDLLDLTAGDLLEIKARHRSSGTNPSVRVTSMKVLAQGYEFGA